MASVEKASKIDEKNYEPCPLTPAELAQNPINNDQSGLNTKLNDRFRIVITLPNCLRQVSRSENFSDSDKLIFSAIKISTPKVSIPAIALQYLGKTVKMSSKEREGYDDIEVTFRIDSKLESYAILYNWLNFLSDEEDASYGGKSGAWEEYVADIEIHVLDEFRNDVVVAKWKYNLAFITSLNQIEFTYLASDEIEGSFTFAFTDFTFEIPKYQD